jgi:hypothetical protein
MSELAILRQISRDVFGRPHQLEVVQAVAKLSRSFEVEEVIDAARQRAEAANEDLPSSSSVRKNLSKLVLLRIVSHVESTRLGTPHIWTREPSPLWKWLDELSAYVRS